MSKSSWMQIEAGLRSRKAPPPLNDAESFKQDFKARATLMRQDPVEAHGAGWFPVMSWRYIAATAAVMLIVGVVLWPSESPMVTQVKSLQVFAPHSGVIIMTDEDDLGTVVWVTDLESGDGSNG